ncbi:MAG: phage holin family protein [Oscillospiraceae bacterium]|nr:phage holin family protein [Oscillospiraceae bacterium]
MKDTIHGASLAAGAVIGFCFGEINGLFKALIFMMAIDYATGWIKAIYLKELSSAAGFKGIAKKIMILCLVSICHIIDVHVIGDKSIIMSAATMFYIGNEGISILENAVQIGIPVPQILKKTLKQLSDKEKEENNENSKGDS